MVEDNRYDYLAQQVEILTQRAGNAESESLAMVININTLRDYIYALEARVAALEAPPVDTV